jgi:hypothetical protein
VPQAKLKATHRPWRQRFARNIIGLRHLTRQACFSGVNGRRRQPRSPRPSRRGPPCPRPGTPDRRRASRRWLHRTSQAGVACSSSGHGDSDVGPPGGSRNGWRKLRPRQPAQRSNILSSWPCGQQSRPKKRYYADARPARRGNALLRQTGSTAGPVLLVEKYAGSWGGRIRARQRRGPERFASAAYRADQRVESVGQEGDFFPSAALRPPLRSALVRLPLSGPTFERGPIGSKSGAR